MSLNIVTQQGNFDAWIKWNSKAGRFYIKGQDGNELEVSPTSFVMDLENIKTGWLLFMAGAAPDRAWDKDLTTPAPKPSDKHKRGFSVRMFSKTTFGGIVELSSNSMHLCNSINDLYNEYEAQKGANPNMVPVVKFTGSTTMKDAKGMNYKPNFVIEKWTARPQELIESSPVNQPAPSPKQDTIPAQAAGVSEF